MNKAKITSIICKVVNYLETQDYIEYHVDIKLMRINNILFQIKNIQDRIVDISTGNKEFDFNIYFLYEKGSYKNGFNIKKNVMIDITDKKSDILKSYVFNKFPDINNYNFQKNEKRTG